MMEFIPNVTKFLEGLAAKSPLVYKIVSYYYKNLVKNEVELASIKPEDHILCIGGGQCPFSGILLHEYTGARVTIIDNDYSCVCVSRKLIQALEYDKFIHISCNDGENISAEDYSVIHMAVQVSPAEQVFSHIKKGCLLGTRILVRLPKKTLKGFYSIKDRFIFENSCGSIIHHWRNIGSTELFVKSKEKHSEYEDCA